MQFAVILKTLGLILILFSLSMLPPIALDCYYQENVMKSFFAAYAITLSTGLACWIPFRSVHYELKTRDGFIVVVLIWAVLCWFASIPFLLIDNLGKSFTDAIFEATSGLTTTGASIIKDLDALPRAVLYYRQQLIFLGGMGIIVLAVAILPMFGIGGMQLYRAEMPGPVKDSKLTPRITQTAKALWYIYVGLTICCMLAYWAAGMPFFDALGESFATVSTGGFSMHDDSFIYYDNRVIELIASFFMLLGATNFSLHFMAFRRASVKHYFQDNEFRAFMMIMGCTMVVLMLVLWHHRFYPEFGTVVIKSIFNTVSLATTTGFKSTNFEEWPSMLPFLLMLIAIIGGCAASTSGGMKVLRVLLLQKQTIREIKRLIHPHAILPIKFGSGVLPESVIQAMWAFIATFILLFTIFVLILIAQGNDFTTAFGAVAACLANAGNGIGKVAQDFASVNDTSKWILIVAMLLGRLEIFTIVILFTPTFWRK